MHLRSQRSGGAVCTESKSLLSMAKHVILQSIVAALSSALLG